MSATIYAPVPIQEPITDGVTITSQAWINFFNLLQNAAGLGGTTTVTGTSARAGGGPTGLAITGDATGSTFFASGAIANLVLTLSNPVAANTYTPTAVPGANMYSVAPGKCIYTRIGSGVTVFGYAGIVVNSSVLAINSFTLSLPIAAVFSSNAQLAGLGSFMAGSVTPVASVMRIYMDSGSPPMANFTWSGTTNGQTSGINLAFSFSYTTS